MLWKKLLSPEYMYAHLLDHPNDTLAKHILCGQHDACCSFWFVLKYCIYVEMLVLSCLREPAPLKQRVECKLGIQHHKPLSKPSDNSLTIYFWYFYCTFTALEGVVAPQTRLKYTNYVNVNGTNN